MIERLFGKKAGMVSALLVLVVSIVQYLRPDLLSTDAAIAMLAFFGLHGTASASAVR